VQVWCVVPQGASARAWADAVTWAFEVWAQVRLKAEQSKAYATVLLQEQLTCFPRNVKTSPTDYLAS
jgi:hypothetical protein